MMRLIVGIKRIFKPLLESNTDNYSLCDLKAIIENKDIPMEIRELFSKEYLERTKTGQKNRHTEKMAMIIGTFTVAMTFCIGHYIKRLQ